MRCKEAGSITSIRTVRQVSRSDEQRPITNQVSNRAVDLGLARRVSWNLATILQIAGKSKQDHAFDLGLDIRAQLLDRVVHDGTSLTLQLLALGLMTIHVIVPVSTCHNIGLGAFLAARVELVDCSLDILRCRVLGQEVLAQTSCIGTTDTLAADIARKPGLQAGANLGSNDSALKTQ